MSQVLEGIRVLDFGRYIAGPYCACLLGDMGADVIRVEKSGGSEDRWVVPIAEGGEGSLFMQVNRNKRGITLNPRSDEGREIVRKLVATSDVVVATVSASEAIDQPGEASIELLEGLLVAPAKAIDELALPLRRTRCLRDLARPGVQPVHIR